MHLSFERGDELQRETRQLPAEHYNKLHLLFARCQSDNLFIPIRNMQYLAIIDREEIVFVDGQGPRFIELAWRDFHPGDRDNLREPVTYTCIYYEEKGRSAMQRLQSEFMAALELVENREPKPAGATIAPFERHDD